MCAIYMRLRTRLPTFRIAVVAFERGGGPANAVPTTGTLLHWEMPPGAGRGYVRGRSTDAGPAGLARALDEAWRECRRWRP